MQVQNGTVTVSRAVTVIRAWIATLFVKGKKNVGFLLIVTHEIRWAINFPLFASLLTYFY